MRVHVRLFASFAQLAGFRERDLDLPAGARALDVLTVLRKGPLIGLPVGATPLFAVNLEHAPVDHPLAEGDEVAVFPPVAGG